MIYCGIFCAGYFTQEEFWLKAVCYNMIFATSILLIYSLSIFQFKILTVSDDVRNNQVDEQ